MLTLQRASAGSGKTYTLTKKFIRLLISISKDGEPPRLRTDAELRDSVSHILAITFTNKATAEMTDRILSRLDELAYHADPAHPEKTTYLKEFMDEFDATTEEISHACGIILNQILYSFSDFNVRTIDTFFQSVLRTFAYESDLPDNYEVVIDNKFVTRLAVSSMLDAYNDHTLSEEVRYFLTEYIKEEMKTSEMSYWNVFSKKERRGTFSKNLFTKLCKIGESLDDESAKEAHNLLKNYLADHGSLLKNRDLVDDFFFGEQARRFARMRAAAVNLLEAYETAISAALPEEDWIDYIPGKSIFVNTLQNKIIDPSADPDKPFSHTVKERDFKGLFGRATKRLLEALDPYFKKCKSAFAEFDETYTAWASTFNTDLFLWKKFRTGFPNLAILNELGNRIDNLMLNNGTLQLSSTNRLLSRIIDGDDVPFIYERYGTRLNHFLIDEFQDTSLLQWENILPLLNESNSRQNENLIIGDAKQSIYRFRGADPTLITERVPEAFSDRDERGNSIEDNSNYRSERRIVEFNNFIFRGVSKSLQDGIDLLYANTVQLPANRADRGYVETIFIDKRIRMAGEEEEASGKKIPSVIGRELGKMIADMHARGYLWKEIAILVISNQAAAEAIEYLIGYNHSLPEGAKKIEFVSEEALTLSASEAVRSVIGCLRMIQNGLEGKLTPDEDEDNPQNTRHNDRISWSDIAGHFRYYSIRNADLPLQERIERFLDGDFEGDVIDQIISGMQAVTLPSLVEALTEAFVPHSLREEDAVFLAAFQDAVLDYCEIYPADIGSMLRWWDRKGSQSCITSPEGTDAVSIMTIHKSKGLEFECVILPEFDLSFDKSKFSEWIEVPEDFPHAELIPKMIQLDVKSKTATDIKIKKLGWEDTDFAHLLKSGNHFETIDTLNKGYVAMTRPISELYIFSNLPGGKDKQLNTLMNNLLCDPQQHIDSFVDDDPEMMINPGLLAQKHYIWEQKYFVELPEDSEESADKICFTYGSKPSAIYPSVEKRRKSKVSLAEQRDLTDYFVNSDRPLLQYREENAPRFVVAGDEDRLDPRSEGSLLHAVLEHVEKEADLPKAFERLRIRGALTQNEIPEYFEKLSHALESVRDRRWFDGTYRVLAERPILKKGELMHRPDRVMLDREGNAIVVDYKFGSSKDNGEHLKQVSNYMRRLSRALNGAKVTGYLWYINEGKVLDVRL